MRSRVGRGGEGSGWRWGLAAAAALWGAGLGFVVQPMVARVVLPVFGGSAAVWTSALLFFQGALLLGYGYAHWVAGRRGAVWVHWGVMGVSLLGWWPLSVGVGVGGEGAPVGAVLGVLWGCVGGPFVVTAATASLLQARAAGSGEPYRLYAWSNVGSIGGLVAYPLVVEPLWGVEAQLRGWSWGYLGFVGVMGAALWGSRRVEQARVGVGPGWGERVLWGALAAVGVALLMGVSDAVAEDLTVTPLLWVGPLLLYLLSFVVAFGRGASRRWFWAAGVGAAVLAGLGVAGWRAGWVAQLSGYGFALFAGCMALHGELWRRRPDVGGLTGFYLWVAGGGALGGVAVAVVAPVVFPLRVELPLAVLAGVAVLWWAARSDEGGEAGFAPREGWRVLGWAGVAALVVALAVPVWRRVRGDVWLYRGFYGALQVKRYGEGEGAVVHLLDGRISHGFQRVGRRGEPTAYFVPEGGVGRVLSAGRGGRVVEVVGLGAGTLAAYAGAGDRFVFYEINPDVVTVAGRHFTFVADAVARGAGVEVVVGDGRRAMAARPMAGVDVVVLDAFSGDAIPAHLLTREAVRSYLARLGPGGLLVVNVANQHAALWRVAAGHAAALGLEARRVRARASSPLGPYVSDFVVMGRRVPRAVGGEVLDGAAGVDWTDDFAPLWPILRL